MNLKPYPEYKDSGVPWLGQIPVGWEIKRFKNVMILQRGHDLSNDKFIEGVFPVYGSNGIIGYHKFYTTKAPCITVGRSGSVGAINFVKQDFWAHNTALFVLKNFGNNWNFLFYLLKSINLRILCGGSAVPTLNRNYIHQFVISIPSPASEQTAIARFLDWKTAQIARYIRAKQKMIALLKEQKQAIINDAVTGKIDVRTGKPYPEYKDSGVEWLGKIPVGWDVKPLKILVKSNLKSLSDKTNPDYEFNYLEINNVKEGYILRSPTKMKFRDAPSRARRIAKSGDTIISNVRTYLRSVCHIDSELSNNLVVSTGFSVLTPKEEINSEFLGFLLRGDNFIERVIINSIGVSYPAISDSKLSSLKVPFTSKNIQLSINQYISDKTKNIDVVIHSCNREIELMKEYRDRLIADVVTGKIDLRGIDVPEIPVDEIEPDGIEETEETEIAEEEAPEGEE